MSKREWKMSATCMGCLKACPTRFQLAYVEGLRLAEDTEFQRLLRDVLDDEALSEMRARLSDPALDETVAAELRTRFGEHPMQRALQQRLRTLWDDPRQPRVASWFTNDERGLQTARIPASHTIGRNYAWRTYYTGMPSDYPRNWRPDPEEWAAFVATHAATPGR